MPLEQTITIVNNSGKIISTGKHLASIFKEAKASYQEKKAEIKSERSLQRAQTFDNSQTTQRRGLDSHEHGRDRSFDHTYGRDHRHSRGPNHNRSPQLKELKDDCAYDYDYDYDYDYGHGDDNRRRSYDAQSVASSRRSHRSKASRSTRHHEEHHPKSRPALTVRNLKTLSEVSSTSPSKASARTYHSPYAETLPLGASRMDLTQISARSIPPTEMRQESALLPRRRSESELVHSRGAGHDIDMNLAYGDIPPDLESRIDLDPTRQDEYKETRARQLVLKVEGLLDEAHCLQHSATGTITHLQKNPESAAAVALTLAELSTLVTKMSPAFLGFLKGGSPAVFGLLASPHFLIGTSIAVGMTVVMFGGWKIVKKVKEQQNAREAIAFEGVAPDRPAPMRTQSEYTGSMDEALVIEEELSSIESWRRGIVMDSPPESVDMELITPTADRAARAALNGKERRTQDDSDVKSQRSTRSHKTHKSHKSSRTTREDKDAERERKGGRHASAATVISDASSRRSSSSKKEKKPEKREVKAIEDGRSRRGDSEMDLVLRPKAQRQGSNMLKVLFKSKKDKETEMQRRGELVLA